MEKSLEHLVRTVRHAQELAEASPGQDVISVSETISTAATAYEAIRNALEYDEEHLLRRNAIRRMLKRRLEETDSEKFAPELLRELIWARYLPNKRIPEKMVDTVTQVLRKYEPLFASMRAASDDPGRTYEWLIDLLSVELEYTIVPPLADEALASMAYQELRTRAQWHSGLVAEGDRDLQLYIAVHRAVLKSNVATLRFRVFTLYYPAWTKASRGDALVEEVAHELGTIIQSVERQLRHPGADPLYRLVRKHAVVFHVLRDVAAQDPDTFVQALEAGDEHRLDNAIAKAAKSRYDRFKTRLRNGVLRAVLFLFLTKMVLALLIEFPYETFVIQSTNRMPLLANILFHPLLLGAIGLSVRIPQQKNTKKITEEAHAILGLGEDFTVPIKLKRPWAKGTLGIVFKLLYTVFFVLVIGVIATFLAALHFNVVSIIFFVFFLTLVTYFGLKIRNTKRELVIVESGGGVGSIFATIIDVLFLPIISTGRWISLRAPRVNIFLFFFDFIIEAPFKAAIGLIEGWLAFVREKKEEI